MRKVQHYAVKTIIRQVITIIASLIAGSGILMLSIDVARMIGMTVDEYDPAILLLGGIALLFIIYGTSKAQP